MSIILTIQDTNDNAPIFSQESYYANVKELISDPQLLPQLVAQFEISDKDLGVYGVAGLDCFLLGNGADKFFFYNYKQYEFSNILKEIFFALRFFVDTVQQKIFLKPCQPSCTITNFDSIYYLTFVCKDNKGFEF